MERLLLIDGNAIMHRAFHALPTFRTKSGVPTNVVYGFFSMLHKAVVDFKPSSVVVCFDTPAQTFRNKMFKEYQAQRPAMDNDFIVQIPLLHEALDKAHILHLEKDGYEADDIIGTVSQFYKKRGGEVLILTGDKDIMQLVDKNVYVISPQLGLSNIIMYDTEAVEKRFSLKPNQIPDLKALMGDSSDNYPGAKGIGPKTAAKLLGKYKTIENMYDHIDQIDEKNKKTLIEYKKNVLLSKQLATIVTDVALDQKLKETKFAGFHTDLKEFLLNLNINTLTKRLFPDNVTIKEKPKPKKDDQAGLF